MTNETHGRGAGDAQGYPAGRYAWYVVAILTFAYVVSAIDRQIISLLVEPIKADLGLSDTQMSLLMGLAFGVFYTLMGIPLGRMADRYSRRAIIGCGVAVWCTMTAACGLAQSYIQLFMARVGVGVGEASLTPSALSMISDYFPREKRGRAIGIYNMGIGLGVGLALILGALIIGLVEEAPPLVLPYFGALSPWQTVFIVVGLPGLLIPMLMFTVREPRRRELLDTGNAASNAKSVPLSYVRDYVVERRGAYGLLFLGMSIVTMLGYAYFSWVPTMFIRTYDWTMQDIGVVYGLVLLLFGPLSVFTGGWLADRLFSKGYRDGHLRVVLGGAVMCLLSAPIMSLMPSGLLAAALLIPANMGIGIANALSMSALVLMTPNQLRGQMSALYLFTISIIGLTAGPTSVALLTDYVFADESDLRYSIAIVSALATVTSCLILRSNLPYFRRVLEESEQWGSR